MNSKMENIKIIMIIIIALYVKKNESLILGGPSLNLNLDPIINTSCGSVQGQEINGVHRFLGIPYAVPPTGFRRWNGPVPMSQDKSTCWTGTYKATEFGNSCIQRNMSNLKQIFGSEDCLYLNVWKPKTASSGLLPVMVWIHGGYLLYENGNIPAYSPDENLVLETDMVYVSMNYRLHAFGFMALDIISQYSSTHTSGNYGLMDQILVLKWIQENIRNFGGDPTKVTLFGQSSGGTSIYALLASPKASGLFHKAWLMSASPVLNKTTADASKENEVFLRKTGCKDIYCLHQLPAEDIVHAVPWDEFPFWSMDDLLDLPTYGRFDGALIVIDGDVLPDPPFVAWAKGRGVDVPIVIGSTAQEVDYEPLSNMSQWNWTVYETKVKQRLLPFGQGIAETALKLYPSGEVTPEFQYTSMASDLRVRCGTDVMSSYVARGLKSPVYRYIVTSKPSKPVVLKLFGSKYPSSYSFHAWDCFAFFKSIDSLIQPSSSDIEFEKNIRKEIMSFVMNGRPNSTEWLPYPDSIALLSNTTVSVDQFGQDRCLFWLYNGFFSYSWIN